MGCPVSWVRGYASRWAKTRECQGHTGVDTVSIRHSTILDSKCRLPQTSPAVTFTNCGINYVFSVAACMRALPVYIALNAWTETARKCKCDARSSQDSLRLLWSMVSHHGDLIGHLENLLSRPRKSAAMSTSRHSSAGMSKSGTSSLPRYLYQYWKYSATFSSTGPLDVR